MLLSVRENLINPEERTGVEEAAHPLPQQEPYLNKSLKMTDPLRSKSNPTVDICSVEILI
jgi:hypothetical protein